MKAMKRYQFIATVILAIAALLVTSCGQPPRKTDDSRDKAAIIDQLYLLEPNPAFIAGATAILESHGFTVDLWQGKEITVDFYR